MPQPVQLQGPPFFDIQQPVQQVPLLGGQQPRQRLPQPLRRLLTDLRYEPSQGGYPGQQDLTLRESPVTWWKLWAPGRLAGACRCRM